MRFWASIIAASLVSLSAGAQEASAPLAPASFDENEWDGAEISGGALLGLIRHGDGEEVAEGDARTFGVDLPPSVPGDILCVRIITSDGLYIAEATYDLSDAPPGKPFSYPTRYGSLLDSLDPGALAIRASAGPCTSPPDPEAPTYAATWRNTVEAPLLLLVKTFGADEAFVVQPDGLLIRCTFYDAGGVGAVDHLCPLPDDLRTDTALQLLAITDGIPSRPVSLPIRIPAR